MMIFFLMVNYSMIEYQVLIMMNMNIMEKEELYYMEVIGDIISIIMNESIILIQFL